MRLQVLVLFLVAVASKCEEEKIADELYQMAEKLAAPFTYESDYNRMPIFGHMVTLRTFDVILINNSTISFKLNSAGTYCNDRSTVFTDELFPEDRLPASSTTYFGVNADRGKDLDLSCYVHYESADSESRFVLRVPSSTSQWISRSSWDIDIHESISRREYNDNDEYYPGGVYSQVIYVIRDDPEHGASVPIILNRAAEFPLSEYSESRFKLQVARRKPKGNRNRFVKASKSGSRVYSM